MPREFPRTRRVGEQVRRELAQLIRDEIRDPRMTMVSITTVEVSRDLAYAKVYVTYLGAESQRVQVVEGLNHAASMLRRELGRNMRIRTVPRLSFVYDEAVERGARLSSLINQAVAADAEKHKGDDDGASQGGSDDGTETQNP